MEVAVLVVLAFVAGAAASWFMKDKVIAAVQSAEARVAAAQAKLEAAKDALTK